MASVIDTIIVYKWLLQSTSAALYSMVSSARANGLEPYAYLRRLFTELPKAKTVEDFEAMLPFNTSPHHVTAAYS